jgi:hypothetical protein
MLFLRVKKRRDAAGSFIHQNVLSAQLSGALS